MAEKMQELSGISFTRARMKVVPSWSHDFPSIPSPNTIGDYVLIYAFEES